MSAIVVDRRLDTTTATMMTITATSAIAMRRGSDAEGRSDQYGDQVHDLDQRVDRRAGGVFERVTDGVADDRRFVCG
ncbi:MAG: hypothetical protein ABS81_05690 [Pseudonocardia sp. SCN 72-86]|nr:MAG: hypothetical protein ABS81_05690 [Pseudonocardia sp. SCN 72-86]